MKQELLSAKSKWESLASNSLRTNALISHTLSSSTDPYTKKFTNHSVLTASPLKSQITKIQIKGTKGSSIPIENSELLFKNTIENS
jgi:hypothetical protein